MKKIILDTNFIIIPYKFNVDIFSEIDRISRFDYELCVIDKTIEELNKLAESGKGGGKRAAKLALALLKSKKVRELESSGSGIYADDALLEIASPSNIIATQDIELKRRLKAKGVPVITLRQKKYLILMNV